MAGCLQWQGNLYADRQPQQSTWAPTSSLRADATQDRFTMPKASVAVDGRGVARIGLSKKPHLRIMGPAFEQAKAQENYEAEVALLAGQHKGQRFAAAAEFQQHVQQQRARQEEEAAKKRVDGLTAALNRLPKYLTSGDNILADTLSHNPPSPAGSRPASRPHSPEVAAKAQKALRGHLAIGSLLPEDESESEDEEQQEGEEENVRQLGAMAAAEAAYMQAYAREGEIMADYPHGAPKRTRKELQQQGITLPGLGFTSRATFDVTH
ncbi:hypothetical protein OEZ86_007683 [Tetradesmus obliquus]|nr:hypothetical protein OEZ86_007683 [Tetradesmus obliquus]